jgi:hypothetical protein
MGLHALMTAQKFKRREMTGSILQMLESHTGSNFHFLWTGDESGLFYEDHHETIWAASWKGVDELERPTHYHKKTMITVFCIGVGEYFLNILPRSGSKSTNSLLERLLVDWKISVISKGEIRTKGK